MAGPAVEADPGHERPRITTFRFMDTPLKSGTFERIHITAHDPDSWISEIQLRWEDPDHKGGIIYAHTHCVQDPEFEEPGIPARLKLDVEFDQPGKYHVEARAISQRRCESGNDQRFSKTVEMDVVVKSPSKSFTDPDDVSGPLDVVRARHSQGVDEATLESTVVHSLAMSSELGDAPLSDSEDWIELFFDSDGDGTYERRAVVDGDESGALTVRIEDPATGETLGEGTATSEGARLRVSFFRDLLGKEVTAYRWRATTHDATSEDCDAAPCEDAVPDEGSFRHRL